MSKSSRRRARARRIRRKEELNNAKIMNASQPPKDAQPAAQDRGNNDFMNTSEVQNMNMEISDKVWYEVGTLDSDKLEKDRYQRPTDPARVDDIVKNFDPALVNLLKVSCRDGHLYIFDGAHTLEVLKEVNKKPKFPVLCHIYHGLTYEQEALLFAKQRGNSKDVPIPYKLRALAEGGDEEVNDFLKRTRESGFSIVPGNASVRDGYIAAVKTAHDVYRKLGPDKYSAMMTLIKSAWAGEAWSVSQNMLRGMAEFYGTYEDSFKAARFMKRLRGVPRNMFERTVGKYYGMSPRMAYALGIATLYNKTGGVGTRDLTRLTVKD